MPEKQKDATDERFTPQAVGAVEPERVRFSRDAFHVFHLSVDDETFEDVRPVRLFPVSGKAPYVSFQNRKGKEVCLLARPKDLDEESRKALREGLSVMYYMPKIQRIDRIHETWGITHWEAQTDRGYARFEVVSRELIRRLPRGRFIIIDADGNRFEIENIDKLDERSQMLVQSET